jgi:cytochrome P450 / NADPH-cytochrome P450 reductase
MIGFLKECFPRANRPQIVQAMMRTKTAKYEDDIKVMRGVAEQSKSVPV